MEFAKVLAKNAGVSLPRYREAFLKENDERYIYILLYSSKPDILLMAMPTTET